MAKGIGKGAPKVVGGLLAAGVLAMGGAEPAIASACPEHEHGSDSGGGTSVGSNTGANAASNTNSGPKANSANTRGAGGSRDGGKAESTRNKTSTSGAEAICTDLTGRANSGPCV